MVVAVSVGAALLSDGLASVVLSVLVVVRVGDDAVVVVSSGVVVLPGLDSVVVAAVEPVEDGSAVVVVSFPCAKLLI